MEKYEKRLPPPARFGRYEAETFRVYAEDLLLQRLAGAFFRKIPQCRNFGLQSEKYRNLNKVKNSKNGYPPVARFGGYRVSENLRINAEDLLLQRLAGTFFRKIARSREIGF